MAVLHGLVIRFLVNIMSLWNMTIYKHVKVDKNN